jgi:hypothetical protein
MNIQNIFIKGTLKLVLFFAVFNAGKQSKSNIFGAAFTPAIIQMMDGFLMDARLP